MIVIDWVVLQQFLGIAVSAFVGASAAFYLQIRQKRSQEEAMNLAAGNYAIFLMQQQYGVLNGLKKNLIDPYKDDPVAWLNMPAVSPQMHDDLHYDKAGLQFLINSDNPNILTEIMVEERRFFEAVRVLNQRTQLHLNQLQPKLQTLGILPQNFVVDATQLAQLEVAIGPVIVEGLRTFNQCVH